jgi:hypothetical protein
MIKRLPREGSVRGLSLALDKNRKTIKKLPSTLDSFPSKFC